MNYESPLEHSSSPPYPGPFWFDANDGTICFRDEHQSICRLADIPDYDAPMQAATAALAALCLNSHDALLAACKESLADYAGCRTERFTDAERAKMERLQSAIRKATQP